jgi:hypothetical protein
MKFEAICTDQGPAALQRFQLLTSHPVSGNDQHGGRLVQFNYGTFIWIRGYVGASAEKL